MTTLPKGFAEDKKPQLFDGLSARSLQNLLACSSMREYDAAKLLVQQGDVAEGIYLILEGSVKTLRFNEEGGEATICMLGAGETCMEAVLFMSGLSPISVQTLSQCKLLLIPEKVVRNHALHDPQFAVNILRIVTRYYKNAMQQIDIMRIKSPLKRVGYYFLTKHLEDGYDKTEFTLPFKKQVIANYLGMTPETFSRTLNQLKAVGVSADNGVIRMQNVFALCSFCDCDSAALCPRYNDMKGGCPLR